MSAAKPALMPVVAGDVSQCQHGDNDAKCQRHDGSLDAGRRPQQPAVCHGSTHRVLMVLPAGTWRWRLPRP